MVTRVLSAVVLVVVALALLVVAWPQLLHLERTPLIAEIVPFRIAALLIAVAVLVPLLLITLVSRRARRFTGALAALVLAFGAFEGVVVSARGTGDDTLPRAADGDITVLEWNTLGGAPGAQAVADLVEEHGADVVMMPETTQDFGAQVAALLDADGTRMQVLSRSFSDYLKARNTTMLISDALGGYRVDTSAGSTRQLPSVVARPTDGAGPTFVALHAVSPISEFSTWRTDLAWAAQACRGANTIMAGDANSTVDHWTHLHEGAGTALGQCTDAASASRNGAVGTWPTRLPGLIGTPIDHVLYGSGWRVTGMRIIRTEDHAGSDHRPIIATLTPTTGAS